MSSGIAAAGIKTVALLPFAFKSKTRTNSPIFAGLRLRISGFKADLGFEVQVYVFACDLGAGWVYGLRFTV
jgi:hypothetical protein